jgi:serine/threonine protein kinase
MIPGKKKLGVCIVMELCEMGDLTAYLKDMRDVKRGVVSGTVALAWIEEMSSALAYMHGENTLHRDLKPLNIFISRNSVKIGDFGLARQFAANRMSRVGTPCYLAPEVLNSERYAEEADIWGLG